MDDLTVSVVIPTRDRPGFLAQSLRSVLTQEGVALDVVVVDDGSKASLVDEVPAIHDPRVRIVRHDVPRGTCGARNAGIEAARGTWVAFLDDDDLWAPQKLSRQLRALLESPHCQWACTGVVVVNGLLRIIGYQRPPGRQDVAAEMLVRQTVPGGGSGVIAARDLLERLGGFDARLALNGDWDMYLRLAQASPMGSVDAPLLAYRVHRTSASVDVESVHREFAVMEQRYARCREAHSVTLDRAHWDRWRATAYLRAGRRWRSLQTLRASGRHPGWFGLARDLAASMVPGSVRIGDYLVGRKVPSAWRADAEGWLEAYR